MGAHRVHEHQPPAVEFADRVTPHQPQPLVAFARSCRSFSAVPQALACPAGRRLAHLDPTNREEELAPLAVGSPWSSLKVFFEQSHGCLVQLRTLAGPPLRYKRAALVEPHDAAIDRGAVNPEPADGLAFGDAPSEGLYYLFAQVYRRGFHADSMLGGSTLLQPLSEIRCSRRLRKGAYSRS